MSSEITISAAEILLALASAAKSAEIRQLLAWEKHWYEPEGENPDPDDLKREAEHLRLSATESEITALANAATAAGAVVKSATSELVIDLPRSARQPQKILLTPKIFSWIPAAAVCDGNKIALTQGVSVREALQLAVLSARFPHVEITLAGLAEDTAAWEAVPASARRVAFRGIILGRKPSAGLRLLDQLGLLEKFLPEVTAGRHLTQNRFHAHDIFEHLLRSVDGAYDLNEPVRWAALLHDVGKVPTRVEGPNGEATFHNHEMYSARMAVPIMKRLAVPIAIGQKVKFLTRNHMFHYTDEWSDKAVRRFVKKVPLEELQDLISLRLADRKGSGKKTAFPKALQKLIGHIDEIIAKEKEFKIRDLAIDGHTLMELGMPASRAMGDMLKFLFEEVKANRLENTVEVLTAAVKQRLGENQT